MMRAIMKRARLYVQSIKVYYTKQYWNDL